MTEISYAGYRFPPVIIQQVSTAESFPATGAA